MTQDIPDYGTPEPIAEYTPSIETVMLRAMVDQLTQQVSDLSRYLIAAVDASGGNLELATSVIESLDAKDSIDVSIDPTRKWIKLKVVRHEG